ncbi:c-type cytochrome [Edaphobacter modestus]|uniref:Quinoprotein glucose dehydrogenase n=1 Tax=Edaphobacter modestus TaxID=388466 RepID=A0A4Q7YNM4_9BACT|nr:c-type cytochrome [Edaphobacter modestus]RZU39362.1 quinoprotein glucose dehydrogenase [Edaphobacter modestus]
MLANKTTIALSTVALLAGIIGGPSTPIAAARTPSTSKDSIQDWPSYGGQPANDHYSPLKQVNKSNVSKLKVAWTYDTGEDGGMETNPLVVGKVLYSYTPSQKVIALDSATGKLLWRFDSGITAEQPTRGLSYWTDGKQGRLFAGIMNYLYALDPKTGKPIADFGEAGRIDLRKGLRGDYHLQSIALTTPGIIYKDLIIVGGEMPETLPAAPGDIRAYDVHTGATRWTFHTIPHPGEFGYETWPADAWQHSGAANNWSGMSLDIERGIVYVPTGSTAFDFYGGDRLGNNLFANTLLALDVNTGKRIWHFQGVHHDIWDRDFPSAPSLVTIRHNGKNIDAIAQTTKQGFLYLFDRSTGAPLFPIEERKYPASTVPGEIASPTQPHPLKPEPYARQILTEDMLTNRTPEAHAWAVQQFRTFRSEGQFVPFGLNKQTVIFPGFDGGAEWGGPAVDVKTGVIYINANEMAWTGGLQQNDTARSPGEAIYRSQCSVCHGADRSGSPPGFPSLVEIEKRLSDDQIKSVVHHGKGRMPTFPNLSDSQLDQLLAFLKNPTATPDDPSGDKKEMESLAAASTESDALGGKVYQQRCAICHGDKREGNPPSFPMLIGVGGRLSRQQIVNVIHQGRGRMPGFSNLGSDNLNALLRFLGALDINAPIHKAGPQYSFTGYRKFLDPDHYPAIAPPWGTLNAIDLNTGEYLWKVPLGEYPDLAAKGMKNTGSENYGGPIVTAGGVVFIGASLYDYKFHAFDASSGKLLWETKLPYAGRATPATYMVDGKQFVVVATGGGRYQIAPARGVYVAFALP